VNWEAVGAIGEVLGAAGVIITLAYLAVQIRQNSRQLERSMQATRIAADDAVARGFDQWRQLLISDEKVSEIYVRGLEDISALDPTERHRFNQLLTTFIWIAWQVWRSEDLISDANKQMLRHLMRHRGGRAWYASHRAFLPEGFLGVLDGVVEELEAEGAGFLMPHESSSMFAGALRSGGESGQGISRS
jgi:hypothetical protein